MGEKIIEKYGKTIQTFVAIEEMSELIKELTKNMRGAENHDAMTEEIADVYIMLEQVMIMNNIHMNEVVNMMNQKYDRMKERLEHESL